MKIPSNSLDQQIVDLCKKGQIIVAIKLYKDSTNAGLKESKDYVDKLMDKYGLGETTKKDNVVKVPPHSLDQQIVDLCKKGQKIAAIKLYKESTDASLLESKNYVDKLAAAHGLEEVAGKGGGGCFVATACYGDYNSLEVLLLRQYRDEKLLPNNFGFYFVKLYYMLSPPIAKQLEKSDSLKKNVRQYFLKPLVNKIAKWYFGEKIQK